MIWNILWGMVIALELGEEELFLLRLFPSSIVHFDIFVRLFKESNILLTILSICLEIRCVFGEELV